MKMRNEIISFTQYNMESSYEAWERYKKMLQRCPHHRLSTWLSWQTFYNELTNAIRTLANTATKGSLIGKSIEVTLELLEEMGTNAHQYPFARNNLKKALSVHELDMLITLLSQVTFLSKQVSSLIA